jgi:hypothetical protein
VNKQGLITFEVNEGHNDIGNDALRLVISKVESKKGGPDDVAKAIGCMVMLLCDFISDRYEPPTARKLVVERVLNIVLAMIADSSFADENMMALAVRKLVGDMLQGSALQ